MADDDHFKLVRLMAGLATQKKPPSFAPYTGLNDTQQLPPFQQGGNSPLPQGTFAPPQPPQMPPVTAQAQAPQPAPMPQALPPLDVPPAMPPMPPPQQVGPQAGIDPNDPRYLPEQWKGAFNPGWQGS